MRHTCRIHDPTITITFILTAYLKQLFPPGFFSCGAGALVRRSLLAILSISKNDADGFYKRLLPVIGFQNEPIKPFRRGMFLARGAGFSWDQVKYMFDRFQGRFETKQGKRPFKILFSFIYISKAI